LKNKVIRKIYGSKRTQVSVQFKIYSNLYWPYIIARVVKSWRIKGAGHTAHMVETRNAKSYGQTSISLWHICNKNWNVYSNLVHIHLPNVSYMILYPSFILMFRYCGCKYAVDN